MLECTLHVHGECLRQVGQGTSAQINIGGQKSGRRGRLSIHEQFSGLTKPAFVYGFMVIGTIKKVPYDLGRPFN